MRVVFIWNNGAFVSSSYDGYMEDLRDLIEQYGTPDRVEVRG
jgi:hypothetical protein